jgi:hypothetical protein
MSGNVKFDKWINDDNSENYKCRAWVNFNGTGTVAIRASGNVSSITDNGSGSYGINLTTAMPDVNYVTEVFSNVSINALAFSMLITAAPTTSLVQVRTFNQSLAATDCEFIQVAIFR